MRRRRFLQLIGLGSIGAGLQLGLGAAPVFAATKPVSAGGRLYRADGGRIYVSADGGVTWQQHVYLGPDYAVQRLATDRSQTVRATVGYLGRTFELALAPNLKSWLTA